MKKLAITTIILLAFLAAGMAGNAHADFPAPERESLIAFYDSTDGENWKTGKRIQLVRCEGNIRVTNLDLSDNQLSGWIPESV